MLAWEAMMRPLACLLVLLTAACADAVPNAPLDDTARAYVRMALEIGTHEGLCRRLLRPPHWRTEAEAIRARSRS